MPMNLGNGIMQAGVIAYDLLWVEHPFPGWQVAVWLMPAIIAAKASHPTEERTMTPEITRRRGGWFVADEIKGWSGPWKTEEAAKLARDGEYLKARDAERDER